MKTEKTCPQCLAVFAVKKSHFSRRIYCSLKCRCAAKPARPHRMWQCNCGSEISYRVKSCVKCAKKSTGIKLTGKSRNTPTTAALSEKHSCAIEGLIRDPRGVVHYFRNAVKFVRENENLFRAEDVVWKKTGSRGYECLAYKGVCKVYSGGCGSWKGWTLVSDVEIKEGGWDLLRRKYQEAHPD